MEAIVSASSSLAYSQDLLIEILSKLPVKSLVRFMSVSQEWSALINSPLFITIHQKYLQRSTPNGYLLYGHNHISKYIFTNSPKHGISFLGNEDTRFLDLHLPKRVQQDFDDTLIHIAGSNNGLVCLQPLFRTPNSKEVIVIWNPATGKYRYLPQPLNFEGQEETNGRPVLGFGFINDNGKIKNNAAEYKVVRISQSKDRDADGNYTYLTQVFTPSENSWREVKNCIPPGNYYFPREARISLDGVFYRLETKHGDHFVFSFNLHDEVVLNIPMPPRCRCSLTRSELFTWENSVAILTFDVVELEPRYELWVMKKEAGTQMPTWNLTAQFTIKNVPQNPLSPVYTTGLRLFVKRHVKAGQDLVECVAATAEATTKAFKLATGTTCRQVVDYKHSLVSVF